MAVYKTFNGTNETIALYSNGNTDSSSDVIVTFLDGVLTLTLSSPKCSDEGLYMFYSKSIYMGSFIYFRFRHWILPFDYEPK